MREEAHSSFWGPGFECQVLRAGYWPTPGSGWRCGLRLRWAMLQIGGLLPTSLPAWSTDRSLESSRLRGLLCLFALNPRCGTVRLHSGLGVAACRRGPGRAFVSRAEVGADGLFVPPSVPPSMRRPQGWVLAADLGRPARPQRLRPGPLQKRSPTPVQHRLATLGPRGHGGA